MTDSTSWITPEQGRMMAAIHDYLRSVNAPTEIWLDFSAKILLTASGDILLDRPMAKPAE